MKILRAPLFAASLAIALLSGCSSAYYGAMEKIGVAKRDILVDRVGNARESQQEAKEQFASALEKFIAVTKVEGGSLKAKYDQLNDDFKRSEARATEVRERIAAVSDVSDALFSEWKKELSAYSDRSLRDQSQRQLDETKRRYNDLMRTMRAAADRMDPILGKFRDQVLFLKHNLNAQAIAGLTSTASNLQGDVSRLIEDMEKSIREADEFIKSMKTS
ncbi:DNA repair protein [Nibricoccus aquaticus]|uniref:DNA repair protein n=1 Tax=Nibricoccus aquaticus TaxID=2576891 RepID=A0A290QD55_9BACT|nr:DUF2959 domain-containing protein [Nibricoccus aquaticus]ATC65150.1 DNA repair protein [Nibricoccus aquaticus]